MYSVKADVLNVGQWREDLPSKEQEHNVGGEVGMGAGVHI